MTLELSTLAGLGPLRHLDLQLVAHDPYSGVTPKRPDATCLILQLRSSTLTLRAVAVRVLAALAGVRRAADHVEGDGQRLVRFA